VNAPEKRIRSRAAETSSGRATWAFAGAAAFVGAIIYRGRDWFTHSSIPLRRNDTARSKTLNGGEHIAEGAICATAAKPQTGARASSRSGGSAGSSLDRGIDAMSSIEQIARRGEEIYESLRSQIERECLNKCICINVATGGYEVGDTFAEAYQKFQARFGAAPSWETRVGARTHVSVGAGLLQ
jgi:hypothetical protein